MAYIQPHGRKRKLKILRVMILIGLVILLGIGTLWTYNTFIKKDPAQQDPLDDVLAEFKPKVTRNLVEITNPFDYVNKRLDKVSYDGKEVDLIDLYDHYGILYYLAEPISDQEINAQFLEIYLFLKPLYKEMIARDYSTSKRIDLFGHEYDNPQQYLQIMDDFVKGLMAFAEARFASTDKTFDKFDQSFIFDDIFKYVLYKEPKGIFMRMQDKPALITRYDRQIFVRMFKIMAVMMQDLYKKYEITYQCKLCPIAKTNDTGSK